nr:hypothetical protein [Tanacetum cinerariifolium]
MTSSSNRRGKANTTRPWTTSEEITLCTVWCNAMEMYWLRDITKKGFWEDVFDNFEKYMGGTIPEYDAIVSKWKNSIRPKVVAVSVVYDGVQQMDENGSSDLVLFQNALAEFQTMPTGWEDPKAHEGSIPTVTEVEAAVKPSFASVIHEKTPRKVIKIRELWSQEVVNGAAVTLHFEAVKEVNARFSTTLYGYFIEEFAEERSTNVIDVLTIYGSTPPPGPQDPSHNS